MVNIKVILYIMASVLLIHLFLYYFDIDIVDTITQPDTSSADKLVNRMPIINEIDKNELINEINNSIEQLQNKIDGFKDN